MQREAIVAAQNGDVVKLSILLACNVPLSKELVQHSRAKPTVQMLDLLASHGWPRPEDWPLSFCLGQDISRGKDLVEWYLARGVPFEPRFYLKAAALADLSTLQLLRQHYGKSFSDTGTLAAAAGRGKVDAVRWLLEAKEEDPSSTPAVDPLHDERLAMNGTPLHFAVESGNSKIVEMLLAAGADPKLKNQQGRIPLEIAQKAHSDSSAEVVRLLTGFPKERP